MALGIGYGLPFIAQHGTNPYKTQWSSAREGAKGAGATVEDENAGVGSCLVARGQEVYTDGLPFTPSLLIVPQFYKAGNLYQDVPPFVAEDMTMRFTVTRATTATRVNSSGLIESVASGVPRIDWQGQSCPALLVEPSAQNLAFHSSDWESNWNGGAASGTTITTGSTAAFTAPDGTTTANEIHPTSGNTNHVRQSNATTAITYTSGTIYTQSAFFKAGVGIGDKVQLIHPIARFSQGGYANFDLINGVVSVVSGSSADSNRAARIENYGNGWYRCSLTATCDINGAGAGVVVVLIQASGDARAPSFAGTVTDYVLGWGAQLETGAVATTYIPTTTGAFTRNADTISASGALVSGLIGQSEGTIYAEVDVRNITALKAIVQLDNGTGDNRLLIQLSSSNTLTFFSANGGNVSTIATGTIATGMHKIGASYSSGNAQIYMDGSFLASGTMANYPSLALSNVSIGSRIFSGVQGNFFNDRIRAAALYTTRLSDDQLAELTKL
jgi:hypothetical protein